MRADWYSVEIVQLKNKKLRSSPECNLIDDWYQYGLDDHISTLFERFDFDIMIVNYVWFSRALTLAPEHCVKIIDTHDIFGGRHDRLVADGIAPAWFYTTPEEEGIGLDRADLVLAIQDEEAEVLRGRTTAPVYVVGHLLPATFKPPRRKPGKCRVGYLASGNPTNVFSFAELNRELRARQHLLDRYEFVLAGPICDAVGDAGRFAMLGSVPEVEAFYSDVDLVINPNLGGTGLKIKTVEALSFGRPFICTVDSIVGIESDAPEHRCATVGSLLDALDSLTSLDDLAAKSRAAFLRYQARQFAQLDSLFRRRSPPPTRVVQGLVA